MRYISELKKRKRIAEREAHRIKELEKLADRISREVYLTRANPFENDCSTTVAASTIDPSWQYYSYTGSAANQ